MLRRHPAAAAALIYAVLSLLMFAPGLVPGRTLSASDFLWTSSPWQADVPGGVPTPFGSNREQADSVQVFQPFLETTRDRLPDIPLWNPYIMAGRPYLANSQSAIFSPFNVPGYVLPLWRSLGVIAALKIFVAAFGMFLLARALAMRFGGALLAGLVFGFSMWMVTWVSWPTVSVWAFLPWICLMTELLLRRPGPLPFAGLAGFVALQYFGGHPESCFHTLLMAVLYWGVRVVALRPAGWRDFAVRALTFGGALAAGTLLAAITLIPFLELVGRSVDSDVRSFLGASHGPHRYLFGLFVHDYWGRQTRTPIEFPSAMEENAYYVGALTLMLALAALLARPSWQRAAFAVLGALALAIATGIQPFFDLVTELPGFSTAHNSRLAVIFVFCVALLAGWGLDELSAGSLARRRAALVAACAALVAFPLVVMAAKGTLAPGRIGDALEVAWLFQDPPSFVPKAIGNEATLSNLNVAGPPEALKEVVRLASLLEWLALAALAFALIALRVWGRLGATAFVALALVLVAGDLFKAGMGFNPGIPIDHAEQPATGAIRYLQSQLPSRFVGLDATNDEARLPPIAPDVGMRYGLYDARGYDYPIERRYDRLWKENVAGKPECLYAFCPQTAGSSEQALRALGLLGVGHLLQDPRDEPLEVEGARLAYAGRDARVYTNPHALPRAFVVDSQRVLPDDEQAYATVTSPAFDARAVAVTHEPAPGVPQAASAGRPAGAAQITDYEDERVAVDVSAARPSLLVLTDSWAPGWKATVDGEDAEVQRVDYLIRGVAVPAGEHEVELRYEPATWTWGWAISLVTLLALAAAALIGWRRRA